jgi:hypothetical protein
MDPTQPAEEFIKGLTATAGRISALGQANYDGQQDCKFAN